MPPIPERAERDWPPVVVASAYQTGVVLMRNLIRRGVNTCCFDWDRSNAGFRSRYGRAYECPNPDHAKEEWLSFMIDLARRFERKPVLIPSADLYVAAIAEHAPTLQQYYQFCHSTIDLQAKLATKNTLYALAAEHGMPIPRTANAGSLDEVRAFASTVVFPCLLKPTHCREWEPESPDDPLHRHPFRYQKLVTAENAAQLVDQYQLAAQINHRVVLQEIIEGPDTAKMGYFSCYGRDGQRIAVCQFREIRAHPIHWGSATALQSDWDDEVDQVCDRFLRSMHYVGLCEIELKRDSRTGQLRMIEANARYTGSSDATVYAGVDLGWIHYLDLIGQDVAPIGPNGRDLRHFVLAKDIATLGDYRREGLETWRSIARSYRPPVAFSDVDLRDWRITLSTLSEVARSILRPLYRKLLRKDRVRAVSPTPPSPV
jgi:D-aspartate ligase